jgi:hypothetical protein
MIKKNNYLSFDGVNDKIDFFATNSFYDLNENQEINITFELTSSSGTQIIYQHNREGGGLHTSLQVTNNNLDLRVRNGSSNVSYRILTSVSTNTLYNVKLLWDGNNTWDIYLDNNFVRSETITPANLGSDIIAVGYEQIFDRNFAYLKLYSLTLQSGTTVANYDFSQDTGNTLVDKIGNNDGTIVGATWVWDGKTYLEVGQFEQAVLPTDKYLAIHNPASNDIPIPALNNKTLNEVFVGGNLVLNPNFDNGTTNWTRHPSPPVTFNLSDNILRVSNANIIEYGALSNVIQIVQNDVVYYNAKVKAFNDVRLHYSRNNFGTLTTILAHSGSGEFEVLSGVATTNTTTTNPRVSISYRSGTAQDFFIDGNHGVYAINLTSIGIASVTKAQMDAYFEAWQRNNAGTLLANTFIQHDQNSVPIADLNGKTLDEVFINSNELELNTISPFFDRVSVDIQNDEMEINLLSISPSIAFSILSKTINSSTNQYYYSSSIKTPNNSQFRLFYSNLDVIVNTLSNQYTTFSGIYNNIASNSNLTFRFFSSNQTIGDKLYLKSTMFINLTALGITATKEQLDFWYSVWQQNHKLGMRVHRASGNDIPLAVLNNQSLNQVFVGGQLVTNGDFSNGTTGWTTNDGTLSVVNGNLLLSNSVTQFPRVQSSLSITSGSVLYGIIRHKSLITNTLISGISLRYTSGSTGIVESLTNNIWTSTSDIITLSNNVNAIWLINYQNSVISSSYEVDYVYLINLTSLGLTSLTQSQLDYLFQVWQFNQVNALVARQFIQEA